jgi:hypothetical protein
MFEIPQAWLCEHIAFSGRFLPVPFAPRKPNGIASGGPNVKTWIDWMSRIAGGMLFQGGYVTSPTMVTGDATRAPEGCEDSRGRPIAARTCHEKGPGDCPGPM